MKSIGKFIGESNSRYFLPGSYAMIDVNSIGAENCSKDSFGEGSCCCISIATGGNATGAYNALIAKEDGFLLTIDEANIIIKDSVKKDILDLDEYGLVFVEIWDGSLCE